MTNKYRPPKVSLTLQLKAFVYRYTGIYLANQEQLEYMESKEFWKSFMVIASDPTNDMSPRAIQGLLIGVWQANAGLVIAVTPFFNKYPRWFFGPIEFVYRFFDQLYWDFKQLMR